MNFTGKLGAACAMLRAGSASFVRDEAGQDLIEYALVASLIALGAVTSMKSVAAKLVASFQGIATTLTTSV